MTGQSTDDTTPQGSIHEGDCAVCGSLVRYVDYCPHIYLCRECGFPDPAPCVASDEDGYAYIIDDETPESPITEEP